MGHSIPVDPEDSPVIDVGDLKHCVDPWITGTAFAEDHLSHPPVVVELLCNLLLSLNDHPIASLDAEKRGSFRSIQWTDSRGYVINTH